jgi:hypothetical protein
MWAEAGGDYSPLLIEIRRILVWACYVAPWTAILATHYPQVAANEGRKIRAGKRITKHIGSAHSL